MILQSPNGDKQQFNQCPGRNCEVEDMDEPIPTFYSPAHAKDAGWAYVNHPHFCEPPKRFWRGHGVWVCPACIRAVIIGPKDVSS